MLRQSGSAPNMDVENVVRDLLDEDAFYNRIENRSSHRDTLVRPVQLQIRGSEQSITAFSRTISELGVGLITERQIQEGTTAVLVVETLTSAPVKFLAQCRWCRPYGKNWKISGWQFINVHR